MSRLRRRRIRGRGLRDEVRAAMSLQQPLMRGREEREAREEVFVVRLDALRQTGAGIAGGDEADEHRVDVDLMFVRGGATAEATTVREGGVDGGVDRDHVA